MTRDDIKELKKYQGYPSITVIVPTHRTIPEKLKDPIKVKNLIGKATDILLNEFDKREMSSITKSLDELESKINFSQTLDGLAFFVNKDIALLYYLPFKVTEKVSVSSSFDTRDLIKAINRAQPFWILALSKKPTRLFKANLGYIQEIIEPQEAIDIKTQKPIQGFPYKHDYEVTSDSKQLAYGSGMINSGYITALNKEFMLEIDNLLSQYLQKEDLPLIIMGTDKDRSEFVQTSKHKDNIVGQIEGAFNETSILEIEKEVVKTIKAYQKEQREEALKLLDESVGDSKVSSGLKETWYQALQGRVRILLVEQSYKVFGTINTDNPEFIVLYDERVPFSESDLIDDLIDKVIEHNGKVIFVDDNKLEKYDHVAAILRY